MMTESSNTERTVQFQVTIPGNLVFTEKDETWWRDLEDAWLCREVLRFRHYARDCDTFVGEVSISLATLCLFKVHRFCDEHDYPPPTHFGELLPRITKSNALEYHLFEIVPLPRDRAR